MRDETSGSMRDNERKGQSNGNEIESNRPLTDGSHSDTNSITSDHSSHHQHHHPLEWIQVQVTRSQTRRRIAQPQSR